MYPVWYNDIAQWWLKGYCGFCRTASTLHLVRVVRHVMMEVSFSASKLRSYRCTGGRGVSCSSNISNSKGWTWGESYVMVWIFGHTSQTSGILHFLTFLSPVSHMKHLSCGEWILKGPFKKCPKNLILLGIIFEVLLLFCCKSVLKLEIICWVHW